MSLSDQRRIAEKALAAEEAEKQNILNYQAVQRRIQEIARAREETRRKREEAKRKAVSRHPLQDLWDRNGAAIYAANQSFKATYGRDMDAATRKKAIKDATVNGHFSAGAYAGNLVKAATPPPPPPPPPNPYAGAADRIRAAANEIEDEKKIGYVDSERDEVRKLIALNEQKNAPVDSATASYMAMAAAAQAGKFSKEDYDRAREQATSNRKGPKVRARRTPDGPECKWWEIGCHAKKLWDRLRGGGEKQPVPTATPTLNPTEISAIYTQVAGTMLPPTAQPTPTLTPMPTATPIPASSAVVFCGSMGSRRMNEEGPECTDPFLAAWNPNKFGFPDYGSWGENLIQYPGYLSPDAKNGKYMQFMIAKRNNIPLGDTPIIIGYSVGAEPALMYTRDIIRQGGTVKSVVLLDPTFTGIDDGYGHDTNFNDWKVYMDEIIDSGTSILVVDDNGTDPDKVFINEDAKNYVKPDGADGHYLYQYRPYLHAAAPGLDWINPATTTNLSDDLAAWAYEWAQNPWGQ